MSNYCSFSVGVSSSRVRGVGGEEGLRLHVGIYGLVFIFLKLRLHYGCVIIVVVVVLLVELDHENICSGGGLLLFSSI